LFTFRKHKPPIFSYFEKTIKVHHYGYPIKGHVNWHETDWAWTGRPGEDGSGPEGLGGDGSVGDVLGGDGSGSDGSDSAGSGGDESGSDGSGDDGSGSDESGGDGFGGNGLGGDRWERVRQGLIGWGRVSRVQVGHEKSCSRPSFF
jgi:hypothetical protein